MSSSFELPRLADGAERREYYAGPCGEVHFSLNTHSLFHRRGAEPLGFELQGRLLENASFVRERASRGRTRAERDQEDENVSSLVFVGCVAARGAGRLCPAALACDSGRPQRARCSRATGSTACAVRTKEGGKAVKSMIGGGFTKGNESSGERGSGGTMSACDARAFYPVIFFFFFCLCFPGTE